MEKLYTMDEVAEIIGVHPDRIYIYMNEHDLGSVKIVGNRRIPQGDLELFVYGMSKEDYYEERLNEIKQRLLSEEESNLEGLR